MQNSTSVLRKVKEYLSLVDSQRKQSYLLLHPEILPFIKPPSSHPVKSSPPKNIPSHSSQNGEEKDIANDEKTKEGQQAIKSLQRIDDLLRKMQTMQVHIEEEEISENNENITKSSEEDAMVSIGSAKGQDEESSPNKPKVVIPPLPREIIENLGGTTLDESTSSEVVEQIEDETISSEPQTQHSSPITSLQSILPSYQDISQATNPAPTSKSSSTTTTSSGASSPASPLHPQQVQLKKAVFSRLGGKEMDNYFSLPSSFYRDNLFPNVKGEFDGVSPSKTVEEESAPVTTTTYEQEKYSLLKEIENSIHEIHPTESINSPKHVHRNKTLERPKSAAMNTKLDKHSVNRNTSTTLHTPSKSSQSSKFNSNISTPVNTSQKRKLDLTDISSAVQSMKNSPIQSLDLDQTAKALLQSSIENNSDANFIHTNIINNTISPASFNGLGGEVKSQIRNMKNIIKNLKDELFDKNTTFEKIVLELDVKKRENNRLLNQLALYKQKLTNTEHSAKENSIRFKHALEDVQKEVVHHQYQHGVELRKENEFLKTKNEELITKIEMLEKDRLTTEEQFVKQFEQLRTLIKNTTKRHDMLRQTEMEQMEEQAKKTIDDQKRALEDKSLEIRKLEFKLKEQKKQFAQQMDSIKSQLVEIQNRHVNESKVARRLEKKKIEEAVGKAKQETSKEFEKRMAEYEAKMNEELAKNKQTIDQLQEQLTLMKNEKAERVSIVKKLLAENLQIKYENEKFRTEIRELGTSLEKADAFIQTFKPPASTQEEAEENKDQVQEETERSQIPVETNTIPASVPAAME